MTEEQAQELANVLENPLQAPVHIVSESSVDPTLGSDTVRSGVLSAIIGTGLGGGVIAEGNVLKGRAGFGGPVRTAFPDGRPSPSDG